MRWQSMVVLAFILAVLSGCSRKASPDYGWSDGGDGGGGGGDSYAMAESDDDGVVMARKEAAPRRSRASKNAPAAPPMEAGHGAQMDGAPPAQAPAPAAASRMVHYDGYARLRVARVEDGIADLTRLAASVGGAVERVSGRAVTIRVPVARFQEAFDKALDLGDVLDQSITAEDVTEAFTAVDLRLSTAKATRDRLVVLLAKAEDEQEKLQLVRQIQRVSEQIDVLEAKVRTLADLAARSRITVELVPREALAWQGPDAETAQMAWIRGLSPFRRDIGLDSRKLTLDVPDGMVGLDERRAFVAEAPDGARIWTHSVKNRPLGDAAFWQAAVQGRLGRDFASVQRSVAGDFQVLTLVDRGEDPYTWIVAVRVQGARLEIVQAYLPDPAQAARYGAAVQAILIAAGGAA
jgi:hypothetical protein